MEQQLAVPDIETVICAFSEEHVARLTGLSKGQLRAWDRSGFFVPHYAYEDRRAAYSRVYSFRDVVGLRTIAILRQKYRVSHGELRKVAEELVRRGYGDWATTSLFVVKRQVHFRRPGTNEVEGVWDGQLAMIPIIDVINDVSEKVEELQRRPKDQIGKIEKHRYVVRNASVMAGTRIPTAAIRRFSEAGYTVDQILKEYPSLTRRDIIAALSYERKLAYSA
jgi:uncharacterized protein (DUF433 family)